MRLTEVQVIPTAAERPLLAFNPIPFQDEMVRLLTKGNVINEYPEKDEDFVALVAETIRQHPEAQALIKRLASKAILSCKQEVYKARMLSPLSHPDAMKVAETETERVLPEFYAGLRAKTRAAVTEALAK